MSSYRCNLGNSGYKAIRVLFSREWASGNFSLNYLKRYRREARRIAVPASQNAAFRGETRL